MILTDHFKLRIVQRIIGIKNENKAKAYINENEDEVIAKSIKLIVGSRILHKDFHPAIRRYNEPTFDYYINGTVIIVLNRPQEAIPTAITLYKAELEKDPIDNAYAVDSIVKIIRRNASEIRGLNSKKEKNEKHSRHLEFTVQKLKDDLPSSGLATYIQSLEAEFASSIEISKKLWNQIRELKEQNRILMNNLLYGYKKNICQIPNQIVK
ncbi:hypothetical protein MZM54_03525 [[Brevibacterium] frigoritolerans]|nr:hypothetical protein [Peribacillus frigoritolerans]